MQENNITKFMTKAEKVTATLMIAMVAYAAIDWPIRYARFQRIQKQMKPHTEKFDARMNQLSHQKDSLEQDFRARIRDLWDMHEIVIQEIKEGEYTNKTAQDLAYEAETRKTFRRADAIQAECNRKTDSLNREINKAYNEYEFARNAINGKSR